MLYPAKDWPTYQEIIFATTLLALRRRRVTKEVAERLAWFAATGEKIPDSEPF